MKKKSEFIAKIIIVLSFALIGVNASVNASTISPWSGHSNQISLIDNENVDTLRIRPANASGISYNRFNRFSVSGQPLQLLNLPGQRENSSQVDPASLIIIMVDDVDLNGAVEILGAPADVLFISTSPRGTIKCTGCSFDNIARITMAVAKPGVTIGDATSNIGKLEAATQGVITIKGMDAPGALLFEVLSNDLQLSGTLNIQQPVNKDGNGYTPAASGKYLLGTGMVNAMIGDVSWNYDSQDIENIVTKAVASPRRSLGGKIQGAAVKVTASECLNLITEINTTSDFLSSVRYRDQILLSGESVTVQTFGNCASIINGNISSDGEVAFKSNNDLLFPAINSKIQGKSLVVIAKGRIENKAEMFAHNLELAADGLVNFGRIEGGSKLAVWADKNIYNQFGGQITGGIVDVQSQNGLVRNGARTPYLTPESVVDDLLAFYSGDLILTLSETSEFGTYYRQGIEVRTTNNHAQPKGTSAHITGQILRIKARGFENINPYWVQVPDNQDTVLLRSRVNQVTVAGEDSLEIEARSYILNSSAILRQNNKTGGIKLEAPYIVNERYRNLTLLDKIDYIVGGSRPPGTEFLKTVETRAYTYSPPGIIVSLGDLAAYASAGMVNNAAYLEIYGDATFNVGQLNDWGIAHKAISKKTTKYFECPRRSIRGYICEPERRSRSYITIEDPKDADSLFFVHGNAESNATFTSATLNTFAGFQDAVVSDLIYRNRPVGWGETGEVFIRKEVIPSIGRNLWPSFKPVSVYGNNHGYNTRFEVVNDTLKGFWTHTWTEYVPDVAKFPRHNNSETTSKEFSLFDLMQNAYESMKSTIDGVIAEFDWWR